MCGAWCAAGASAPPRPPFFCILVRVETVAYGATMGATPYTGGSDDATYSTPVETRTRHRVPHSRVESCVGCRDLFYYLYVVEHSFTSTCLLVAATSITLSHIPSLAREDTLSPILLLGWHPTVSTP